MDSFRNDGPDKADAPVVPGPRNEMSGQVGRDLTQIGVVHGGVHIRQETNLPEVVIPRSLPRRPADFLDRVPYLTEFEGLRTQGSPIIVIFGPGGVGKTALALYWLHSLSDQYADGQLHCELHEQGTGRPVQPARALESLLRQLGMPQREIPRELVDLAAAYRSRTAGQRILLMLDNAMTAAQVRWLLPASGSSVVVVTSRSSLDGLRDDGARSVRLDPLEEDASVELLSTIAGFDDHEMLRSAAEHCGRLPLALRIAGGLLADRPARKARIMARLSDARSRLDLLHRRDDLSVRRLFETSYEQLPPVAARLFRLLGLHPGGDFTIGAAAALADLSEDEAEDVLEILVNVSLVTRSTDERHHLHDLLRDYARERAERDESEEQRDLALRRVLDWYLAGAAAADFTIEPGRWRLGPAFVGVQALADEEAAWQFLEAERENLRAAVQIAHERGHHDHVWWLCEALWFLYFRCRYYRDWIETHELGIEAAKDSPERRAEGRMRCQLGFALIGQDRVDEAVREFTAAFEADRAAGHRRGQATALESKGLALLGRERWPEAAEALAENLALVEEGGDPRAIALVRHHLGRALSGAGDHERALALLRPLPEAFLALPVPDPYNRGRALTSLGEAFLRTGRPDEATRFLSEALETMRTKKAVEQQADVLVLLATAAGRLRDTEGERDALTEARSLYASFGSPKAVTITERLNEL